MVSCPLRRFLEREVAVGSVCKVGTQDPENLDEELKPLVTAWPIETVNCQASMVSLSLSLITGYSSRF